MSTPPRWLRRAPGLRALAAYAAITLAFTYPLIRRMTDGVPSDPGDPALVTWILWWNAHTVPFSQAFWNAPAFFPATGVTAFSEHFAGVATISTPIYWLTGNIQLGYNVALLLSFLLSAFFAYLLGRELTGRDDAAFIGGLIYGFTPYRIDQLSHMQMLMSCWMPLSLLGLHRYVRTARARWLVVFGAAWLMQGLSSGYLMMFFAVLVGGWCLWFLPWRRWRLVAATGAAWVLAMLPLVPVLLAYRRIHDFYGFARSLDEIHSYSADITGVLQPSVNILAWHWVRVFPHAEGAIFPGVTAILLIGAMVAASRAPASARWWRWASAGLGVAAVLCFAAALDAAYAPWQITLIGLQLSNARLDKPLIYGAVLGIAWIASHPRFVAGFRRRSALAFYVVAAIGLWLFALGPAPEFFGRATPYTGPYVWLLHLPGFDGLRVPARFAMAMILCLSCAGALAFARLAATWPRGRRRALTAVAVTLALADGWPTRFNVVDRPSRLAVQAMETPDPLIELPIGEVSRDTYVMYRSTYTFHPVVNGYSGNGPAWYGPLVKALERHDPYVLDELNRFGVRQVRLDTTADADRAWQRYFETRPDITLAGAAGGYRLYRLPAATEPIERPFGPPVPIAGIASNVHPDQIPAMTDGDVTTRWESGPQRGIEEISIDLGAVVPVAAVVLTLGPNKGDAPHQLVIEVSSDGAAWTDAWRGPGSTLAFRAMVKDPVRVPLTFDLGDRTARFIRMRQLAPDDTFYWSIAELSVLATSSR